MIKYNVKLSNYKYILSFDLAKNLTGYSLIDYTTHRVILAEIIDMSKHQCESFWYEYAKQIRIAIGMCLNALPNASEKKYVLITKEKLPNQSGRFSSIEALQALAQCHAIFDAVIYDFGVDYYDFDGVHSVSVKAYFKHLTGIDKPTKEDICSYISKYFNYDFSKTTLDVTDSIAVAMTLVDVKYNKDLIEKIKELKKSLKQYKSAARIRQVQDEIARLQSLTITSDDNK